MPIIIEGAADRYIIGEIHGEHPRRRPNIHHMSIDCIAPVREPNRRKMHPLVIGAVNILGELEPRSRSTGEPFQQPPVGSIAKLREVGYG